jgi:hypothetical protein
MDHGRDRERKDLLPEQPETREQKLDREIQQLPRDVREWLEKTAQEIQRTGKIPDDLKKAFERKGPGGDIDLDWINRILERNGSQHRLELKRQGNLHTMELRKNGERLDRHEFHPEKSDKNPGEPGRPKSKPPGNWDDPEEDEDLIPPPRDQRRVT